MTRIEEERIDESAVQNAICRALLDAFPMADKIADNYAAVAVKAIKDLNLKELRAQGGGKGLAGRFLDMWKGEIEDFDKKYGKHIIGTEYEFGSCDTHREEIEEARIKTLREAVPVLSHAVSALETEAVEPK